MKIMLTSLNAKYIHSNLAIRYLNAYCHDDFPDIFIREYTINDRAEAVLGEIYKERADVVAFSCYIWNIGETLQIAANLKKVSPETIIVLGGPEVTYDPVDILSHNPYVDYIDYGEGEETFRQLLGYIKHNNVNIENILGLAYRTKGKCEKNQARPLIKDLDKIPFPYLENLKSFQNKIIYYESTRGCPFQCQYCLSSTIEGVRFFSLDRVKRDLTRFIEAGVKQVKFVDRTFNCNHQRALEIMKFLAGAPGDINFHFEVAADLIGREMLDFLATVPKGRFQFEIGIQSTNSDTLELIKRKMDLSKVKENVREIKSFGNIHQHLDLIAGLPAESYESFRNSFNEVYALKPDMLQLGFLKLLKGSGIRERAEGYGIKYTAEPPYEVLANDFLSYGKVLKLKRVEDLLERYGNSGRFKYSLPWLEGFFETTFDMYERLGNFWEERGYHLSSHKDSAIFEIIYNFFVHISRENHPVFSDLLKLDYLRQGNLPLPKFLKRDYPQEFREKCWEFVKNSQNVTQYLPQYQEVSTKEIMKKVAFELFQYNVVDLINASPSLKKPIVPAETVLLFDYEVKGAVTFKRVML